MDASLQSEIARNFDQFQRNLATYLPLHASRFALMKNGSVVDFFDNVGAADAAGTARFADRLYSIQQVTDEPIELGVYANLSN